MTSVADGVERADDAEPDRYVESNVAAETAAVTAAVTAVDAAPREWADLPLSVRTRIVEWAADVVGGAPSRDLPAALQKVARFAPAKRARRAGTVLADAVRHDEVFRALVAEHAAKVVVDGHSTADRPAAAARAVLLGSPDADDLLTTVAAAQDQADARARVGELERELRILTARLARAQEQLDAHASTPPIDRALTALRLPKATVVGIDLGGAVALRLASSRPERVERLLLINPIALDEIPAGDVTTLQRNTARFAFRAVARHPRRRADPRRGAPAERGRTKRTCPTSSWRGTWHLMWAKRVSIISCSSPARSTTRTWRTRSWARCRSRR